LRDICGREEGAPPPTDLAAEKRNGDFVRGLIERKVATAVHDVSDGGLAAAVAEMAIAGRIGADLHAALDTQSAGEVNMGTPEATDISPPAFWFGEDQARYVVTVPEGDATAVLEIARDNGVPARRIGTTGGPALTLPAQRPILVTRLSEQFENWFPRYMSGSDQGSA
jgi:phosphoribosylformylglycinamidine synthase